jgi:hypothetical protein
LVDFDECYDQSTRQISLPFFILDLSEMRGWYCRVCGDGDGDVIVVVVGAMAIEITSVIGGNFFLRE